MKNLSRHHGTFRVVRRLPQSRNGNPRFYCDCGAPFVTAPDSSHAFDLERYEGKRCEVVVGTLRGKTTLQSIRALTDEECEEARRRRFEATMGTD